MTSAQGPRSPANQEFPELLQFLDQELRPGSSWSIAQEYPTAVFPGNIHNMRIISNEEGIQSHALIRPLIVKTPTCNWKIAAIGSVVTKSTARQRGYSRQVMDSCLREAEKQQCDIAILWSNLHEFYIKQGFCLAGFEESFMMDSALALPKASFRISSDARISPEAIARLYSQHSVNTPRSLEDIRQFLKIPNARIFTAWDASGALAAYAVEGKGADLQGYIHEWSGNIDALLHVFHHVWKQHQKPITILIPHHSQNLIRRLNQLGNLHHHQGYLGLMKVLNPTKACERVVNHARALGVFDFQMTYQEGQVQISLGQERLQIETNLDLPRLIFGPIEFEGISASVKNTEVLKRIFPLPLWIWGWDSV